MAGNVCCNFYYTKSSLPGITGITRNLHSLRLLFHLQVKEEQGPTLEVVQTIQSTTLVLQKAKDNYQQKCEELDKLKRDNASAKDLEKAEVKVKKAQEDYKTIVDKYAIIKEDFEKRMSMSCKVSFHS